MPACSLSYFFFVVFFAAFFFAGTVQSPSAG
jgi:hypothetical protein